MEFKSRTTAAILTTTVVRATTTMMMMSSDDAVDVDHDNMVMSRENSFCSVFVIHATPPASPNTKHFKYC